MFGPALPQARTYARLLTGVGAERGIVGPAEASRIWERHLLNCAVIGRLIPARCSLADVGSGAGLPGIVLALLRPEARVTLVEPMARRADFLRECVDELAVANAVVVRSRAEDLSGKLAADVVTSRAVAPLDKVAGLSAGLARTGGRVLAIKGESAAAELQRARPVLARLGISDARVEVARSASGLVSATVVTFTVAAHQPGARAPSSSGRPEGRVPKTGSRDGGGTATRYSRASSRRGGG
ncbi:MAG: 16S rRNA (guanine(527)-N(7))-methyltransferase RsmG [Actinobacteria bacterium]|nr:16S rRNA (guanine(527)-N(7))-methyltransferase RsmG [Actinomycetota bacterium]